MKKFEVLRLKCKVCGHEWTPRVQFPMVCPRCRGAEYDAVKPAEPKKQKV